jgi:predicted phosphodiesterase
MRHLILSDIHSNLGALEAVLADATAHQYDDVIVLGDLVGYGAEPNDVVERVRGLQPLAVIRGNHDKVCSGLESADGFNFVARQSAHWTLDALKPANRVYLAGLPMGPYAVNEQIEICHGAPADEDAYIFGELDVLHALRCTSRPLCLFGHTHVPIAFGYGEQGLDLLFRGHRDEARVPLDQHAKFLVNPGSVGQPRDGDPRAAYAVFDEAERVLTLYRVAYPVEQTQDKIVKAGLPEALARRLAIGR